MREGQRIATVDWMKAIAIVAVVVTHAGGDAWSASSGFERMLRGSVVQFHVATFFVVAGFLATNAPVLAPQVLRARLQRILVPYVVASAGVFASGLNTPSGLGPALYMLGTGSALGIYYFIFNLTACYLIAFLLTRIDPKMVEYALVVTLVWWVIAPFVVEAPPNARSVTTFWTFRDPTRYFPYFAVGWLARLRFDALQGVWQRHRRALFATSCLAAAAYLAASEDLIGTPAGIPARALYVMAVLAIMAFCTEHSKSTGVVRFLSESSYTIYLFHMFFVAPVLPYFANTSTIVRMVVVTSVGLGGASVLVLVGRAALGPRSRALIGA